MPVKHMSSGGFVIDYKELENEDPWYSSHQHLSLQISKDWRFVKSTWKACAILVQALHQTVGIRYKLDEQILRAIFKLNTDYKHLNNESIRL
jgi:hypothetical protein